MMGEETFHPDTRALLSYGRAIAGAGVAPKRGGANHVLERLFVIERTADGRLPIRTFGTELIALFGTDLREHDFRRFFVAPDLGMFNALISACEAAGGPGIARVIAETGDRRSIGAEILVNPLRVDSHLGHRFLCMFQSLGGHAFLCEQPILRLKIGSLHPPEAKTPARLRLAVVND